MRWPVWSAISLAILAPGAHADERESLETLRQTTLGLIQALVDSGSISRDKAEALLRAAQASTPNPSAAQPAADAARPVQRVPYVPESVRVQMRNEIKEEIVNQARTERWGVPNATPSWADRIKIDGDIRYRHQVDSLANDNTPAATYLNAEVGNNNGLTRAAEFGAYAVTASGGVISTATTTDGRERERLRMRLGITGKVSDEVGVGIRLATGNTTDRVSTNQTLGQGFNKYQLLVDRAFIRLDPAEWLTVQGGRIPNPWYSTEMVWSENLNFEGVSATVRAPQPLLDGQFSPFMTVGWFPLREASPPGRSGRSLIGSQLGASWDLSNRTRLKFGLALYDYRHMEGQSDSAYQLVTTASGSSQIISVSALPRYGQYEYGSSLRQKGNTLFETNPMINGVDTPPIWGLAYKFRPLVLTASAEFKQFSPFNIVVAGEYVNNTAFDLNDFQRRATDAALQGLDPKGKRDGYQLKLQLGDLELREFGDWQLQASYRHVGSDAVLDAFTDSDLGLGGTNVQGFSLGLNMALYRNTTFGIRYLSARSIDTPLNAAAGPNASFKANSLQVDLNVRF
jgi:hypothetical protein